MEDYGRVGERIRRHRIAAGMTQKRLAELLYVTQPCVSGWERGKRDVTMEDLQRVAEAIGIPLLALLGLEPADLVYGIEAILRDPAQRKVWRAGLDEIMDKHKPKAPEAALGPVVPPAGPTVVAMERCPGQLTQDLQAIGKAFDTTPVGRLARALGIQRSAIEPNAL